jgi:hypothetical protein
VHQKWSKLVSLHLSFLLFVSFAVYVYRDIWPLATFTLSPKDLSEGWFVWTKIIILFWAGVVVPLVMPRQYMPFNPREPMPPNPEQVASILSLTLYFFLDPIVFLAYRIPHLSRDLLPVLADYDYAKNLKKRAFPFLDQFSGKKGRRHIFFGLMRLFRELSQMAIQGLLLTWLVRCRVYDLIVHDRDQRAL